mmetsp:Transcript_2014/g.3654  ORF Transcript_2014/g.3654 Transcript_2014/m.3654 type:complete len:269 (+) Transcript_2014:136-942(+)
MRHGRAKLARKTLKFYSINANIKPPYKVILDGNFMVAAIKQKLPITERLKKLLQDESFTIYTTRSILDELNSIPGECFQQARQFGLDECDIIEREDILTSSSANIDDSRTSNQKLGSIPKEDIFAMVKNGNPNGWFIATQDEDLSDKIRGIVNVPLIRLARAVLLLEGPSSATRKDVQYREKGKQMTGGGTMTHDERELISKLKNAEKKSKEIQVDHTADSVGQLRRKRKAKEPNPLSCKKKTKIEEPKPEKKKRIRKRKKGSKEDES